MIAPRYGGVEGLLLIKGRGQPDAETSGRVQGRHDSESYEERGRESGKRGIRCSSQEGKSQKKIKKKKKAGNQNGLVIQGRVSRGWEVLEFGVESGVCQPYPVTGGD